MPRVPMNEVTGWPRGLCHLVQLSGGFRHESAERPLIEFAF